jgi:molecular chaperone GrpE
MNEEKKDIPLENSELSDTNAQNNSKCISVAEYENYEKTKRQLEYLTADFENYKRRSMLETMRATKDGQRKILLDIISIIDDFDCALAAIKKNEGVECSTHLQGFSMMYRSCIKILERNSVREIAEVSVFDPIIHEAVMQVDAAGIDSGSIVEVLEKGYTWNDELLRVAKVSVAA